jgi:hypothetical protein
MTVTARSDEPIDQVTFEGHGCGVMGSTLGLHVDGGWNSAVTPTESGAIVVVVRFEDFSGSEQTLEAMGFIDFPPPV